jgi:hypothetical protein
VKNKNARELLLTQNSGHSTPNFNLTDILTIDADAHLQKLAAHMFPSPALLPVELVRAAIKRRAAAISIQVHAARIAISDNGAGIGSAEWQALACLGDARQTAVAREKAMSFIQDLAHPGIGLLAVFCPGVRSVQIENAHGDKKNTLRIAKGLSEMQHTCLWPQGTRITISRRRGPAAEEKVLLAELCAAVQTEIVINGRRLKNKPLLTDTMASMNITFGENPSRGLLAIPAHGDVCRIWLLDQGIPWQVTAMAPVLGLVFAAALETAIPLTPAKVETLAATATRLYQWLAENYSQFPEPYQSRIENLFFKQACSGGDPGLLSVCAPFRLLHSKQRMTLAEVLHKAKNGKLHVMDRDSRQSYFSGHEREVLSCEDRPISSARIGGRSVLPCEDRPISSARIGGRSVLPCEDRPISSARIGGRSVLLLTPQQKDFLSNHLQLPLVTLNAHQKIKIRPQKILAFCRRIFPGVLRMTVPSKAKILDRNRLSREENVLCLEMEMHWRRKLAATSPVATAFSLSVVMVEGRGLVPAYWLKNQQGDTLQIRRRHPLTLRALLGINQDRDNSELAFAALMPGHFLTDADQ